MCRHMVVFSSWPWASANVQICWAPKHICTDKKTFNTYMDVLRVSKGANAPCFMPVTVSLTRISVGLEPNAVN